jgi:ribonuclease HI
VRFRAGIDGGARGNPGRAAWGVAVFDETGACVEGYAGLLGETTNNIAEYHGLLEALKIAAEKGAEDVEISSDSELLVRQINGRYKVRSPGLIRLFRQARSRIASFRSFRIVHVRRDDNPDADALVNLALDGGGERDRSGRIHEVYQAT